MKKIILFGFLLSVILTSCHSYSKKAVFEIEEGTITNLYDAFGKDTSLTKDFGFSCITKYQGKTILFDAGSNADIFRKNVTKLGVDLSEVDIVVVSHAHFDHINGIDYLLKVNPNVKIYFPSDIFWGAPVPIDASGQEPEVKDSLPPDMQYFNGSKTKFIINQSGRFWKADIEFVKTSKEILPGLNLIATSSQFTGYFSCYPGKSILKEHTDQINDECKNTGLPELSLSLRTLNGQVLIVGCSHTGVENIAKHTLAFITDKIELIYGGFHMLPFDRTQTVHLVNMLRNDLNVHRVAPAHCTGHLAFKGLKDTYGNDYLFAGLGETIKY